MAAAAPSPRPGGAAVSRPSGRGGAATTLVRVGRRRRSSGGQGMAGAGCARGSAAVRARWEHPRGAEMRPWGHRAGAIPARSLRIASARGPAELVLGFSEAVTLAGQQTLTKIKALWLCFHCCEFVREKPYRTTHTAKQQKRWWWGVVPGKAESDRQEVAPEHEEELCCAVGAQGMHCPQRVPSVPAWSCPSPVWMQP